MVPEGTIQASKEKKQSAPLLSYYAYEPQQLLAWQYNLKVQ